MKSTICTLFLASLLPSCSTTPRSMLAGAGVGMSLGFALGSNRPESKTRAKEMRNGAALGAALGSVIGYLADKDKPKRRVKIKSLSTGKPIGKSFVTPSITKPNVRRIWVPDRIDGNQYVRGHEILIIDDSSQWMRMNEAEMK